MRHSCAWLVALALVLGGGTSAWAVDYTTEVKPILEKHCYSCHGALRQKSGLRLDHVSFMRTGGDRSSALADSADESALITAVRGTLDTERMPLDAKPLADAEIATLAQWVAEGAKAPEEAIPDDPRKYWSFQKPVRPELPVVNSAAWATHPVDRFLAAQHESRGLVPAGAAAKNLLLRRVYLDLIGLPPTASELAAFAADDSSAAYERVVDSLLASPRYGERWARHWMDVWRYSDWDGYGAEVRESQPHIWRWRDWIIESLNADKPYDQMVREMLAADELSPGDPQALRATGFLVRNWYKFNRNVWLDATVEHTSKAFLALTLNCARCHDHMFDPVEQTEYYEFRALFEPYDVRTERVPGVADTKLDGLVRVFDAKAETPTYLFARGNEAKPDKEHPLSPGVPRLLGGEMKCEPVALKPAEYYPGLQSFVQQETLAAAKAELTKAEATMVKAVAAVTDARKLLAEARKTPPAAEAATGTAAAEGKPAAPVDNSKLEKAVTDAEGAASLAEQDLLAATANLTAARAKIAADNGAFATPAAADAAELAREASRAERVTNAQQTQREVVRAEQELAAARASGEKDDKKIAEAEKKLAEARKAHGDAQTALGQPSESYTRFGEVYPATSTGRRAALARWIASADNPLTARVAINHMWLRHFGSPLVPSMFDFGRNGRKPTHPALLDWLATELVNQGWQMKAIHRLLVTSTAYQMSSSPPQAEANLARDGENVYLWRMNPRRMEAEVVRDSTLAAAGSLDETMYGADLDPSKGLTVPRRSIYFRSSKEKKVTFLEMFDSANVTDCYRRSETVVPHQALAMVNSSLVLAQSRKLAEALTKELATEVNRESQTRFVATAFERILCRAPTNDELTTCVDFLDAQAARLADPAKLVAFESKEKEKDNEAPQPLDPHARARANLIHVLFNHNDFVTVR